jgi:hypothetical protein
MNPIAYLTALAHGNPWGFAFIVLSAVLIGSAGLVEIVYVARWGR